MPARHHKPPTGFLRRFIAVGSAALVLALTIFASSSELHGRLHSAGDTDGDDGCAVVLFASGVSLPLGAITAPPPPIGWRAQPVVPAGEIFLATPRYLRRPERGPPVVG